MSATIAFAGATLDRAAHLRTDAEHEQLRRRNDARVLLVGKDQEIALAGANALARVAVSRLPAGARLTFLGLEPSGAPVFAADLLDLRIDVPRLAADSAHAAPDSAHPAADSAHPAADVPHPAPDSAHPFASLRQRMSELDPAEAALGAYAVGMVGWHRVHRHCGRCGHATIINDAGHRRHCPNCGLHHFPRTDPAVTMLVQTADKALLSRRHGAPANRWSALAGFVEPGETPEEAVIREAKEETGVEIVGVEYVTSQPWPFPSALMIGFWAFVDAGVESAPEPQPGELVEARWYERAELAAALEQDAIALPPPGTIGNYLISTWITGT